MGNLPEDLRSFTSPNPQISIYIHHFSKKTCQRIASNLIPVCRNMPSSLLFLKYNIMSLTCTQTCNSGLNLKLQIKKCVVLTLWIRECKTEKLCNRTLTSFTLSQPPLPPALTPATSLSSQSRIRPDAQW